MRRQTSFRQNENDPLLGFALHTSFKPQFIGRRFTSAILVRFISSTMLVASALAIGQQVDHA